MSDVLTTTAKEFEAVAYRKAAELVDSIGLPFTYEEYVTTLTIAYLDGAKDQLTWARNLVRGDDPSETPNLRRVSVQEIAEDDAA